MNEATNPRANTSASLSQNHKPEHAPENVLVTGGGGFLGRYIAEQLLDRGDRVTVFARGDYPELRALGATTVRGDLQNADAIREACAGVNVVYHVAAKAGIWGEWDDFYGANVVGTQHVINACRVRGVPKLVFTSSPSVIFDGEAHRGADESIGYPPRYESHYAQTKALSEQMVIEANGDDLLTTSLRPHLIWGPRDTHILPGLIDRARSGRLVQVGDGTNRVDLTYVEDGARAHLLAADALSTDSSVAGSVYFISQDAPTALWPWVNDLLAELDISPVRRRLPLSAARALGGVLEGAYRTLPLRGEPRLTRFLASELALDHWYDVSRARADFGYVPQWSMEAGMVKTVEWLRNGL